MKYVVRAVSCMPGFATKRLAFDNCCHCSERVAGACLKRKASQGRISRIVHHASVRWKGSNTIPRSSFNGISWAIEGLVANQDGYHTWAQVGGFVAAAEVTTGRMSIRQSEPECNGRMATTRLSQYNKARHLNTTKKQMSRCRVQRKSLWGIVLLEGNCCHYSECCGWCLSRCLLSPTETHSAMMNVDHRSPFFCARSCL